MSADAPWYHDLNKSIALANSIPNDILVVKWTDRDNYGLIVKGDEHIFKALGDSWIVLYVSRADSAADLVIPRRQTS